MLNWVSSWWSVGSFTGPARNAPNNGIDIKKLFDQRPKQVISLSEAEVQQELKKLRPTKINAVPPLSNKPPLMKEFDDVFTTGYKNYFEALKRKRIEAKTVNTVIVAVVNATELSSDTEVVDQSVSDPQPDTPVSESSVLDETSDGTATDSSPKSEYVLSKDEILAELDDFQSM